MKFSISLPTCFEGVMYPIPFVEPGDFVRLAELCERLGYDSVWGNDHITSQHYVRELYPDSAPNFYELHDGAVVLRRRHHSASGSAPRSRCCRCAIPSGSPSRPRPSTSCRMAGWCWRSGVGAYREEFAAWAPRLSPTARRGEMIDEGLELMRRLLSERRVTHEGKYYAVRDIEMFPKPAPAVRAVAGRPQHGDCRAHGARWPPAGCRAGGRGPSSRRASRR